MQTYIMRRLIWVFTVCYCPLFNLEVIKLFFMLNSAEHEIFSDNKYENGNNSWHFHIYQQRNFHVKLCLARKNLQLLVIWDLLAGKICWVEHEKCFIASGPGIDGLIYGNMHSEYVYLQR